MDKCATPDPGASAAAGPRSPQKLTNCPKCRTPVDARLAFCTSCGVVIAEMPSVDRPPARQCTAGRQKA